MLKRMTCGVAATHSLSALLACFFLFLWTTPAKAEKADQEKPTNIAADHTESDDLHQIDIFTGSVILTKGTIILRSAKLLVHQDPEGYQSGTATWDGKTPVYFKQKREGFADQYMEGTAERIEYDEKNSMVKLFDHAIVKRLDGAKDADEARGDTITYNSDTEKYFVESGKTQERTYTVIQPKAAVPPATAASPAPTAGAVGASPNAALPAVNQDGSPDLGVTPAATPTRALPLTLKPDVPNVELQPSDTLLTRPQ